MNYSLVNYCLRAKATHCIRQLYLQYEIPRLQSTDFVTFLYETVIPHR